jgi:hypothetical protein
MYDVSLPSDHFYEIVKETRKFIQAIPLLKKEQESNIHAYGYGHVAEGNLKLNVTLNGYYEGEE